MSDSSQSPKELRQRLSVAGDRRDWDECDRIENQLHVIESRSVAVTEEPAPIASAEEPDCWLLVVADMHERRDHGLRKYNVPVHASNGRDALVDAYQEALDKCVYLRAAIIQRERADAMIRSMSERLARQSELLSRLAEKPENRGCIPDEYHARRTDAKPAAPSSRAEVDHSENDD